MSTRKSLCRLSITYGLLSDASWIEAKESDSGFTVTCWMEGSFPEPEIIGRVEELYSWRAFCGFLIKLCESSFRIQPNEGDSWCSIDVTGEKGLAADCLRIAWANANNKNDVLNWLLSQNDEAFRFIDKNFKIIETPADYELLDEVLALMRSTGNGNNILTVLKSADLRLTRDGVTALIDVLEDRQREIQQEKKDLRQAALAPFRERIERISRQFSDERRRLGAGMVGSKPSIRSVIRRWLEEYVVEHGFMPDGAHEVSGPFLGGRVSAGTINFSDLPDDLGKS